MGWSRLKYMQRKMTSFKYLKLKIVSHITCNNAFVVQKLKFTVINEGGGSKQWVSCYVSIGRLLGRLLLLL